MYKTPNQKAHTHTHTHTFAHSSASNPDRMLSSSDVFTANVLDAMSFMMVRGASMRSIASSGPKVGTARCITLAVPAAVIVAAVSL